jgi:putative transposase
MHVEAAFRYRCYPTPEQANLLARTFGCVRVVYNRARAAREAAWTDRKERVGFLQTSAMLTGWKKDPALIWLNEVSSVPLQQALRHLDTAYRNFFQRRASYPNFRRKDGPQSAEFTKSAFNWKPGAIKLAKMAASLDVAWSRPLPSPPSSVTVTREADGRWFVSCRIVADVATAQGGDEAVGIDLGLNHFAALSTGEKIDNPRPLARRQRKVARLQRRLARKQKGSSNRRKAKVRLARAQSKVRDARRDFHHKLSSRLVNENQVICLETLSVKGMMRAKLMSRSIADAGWSEFVRQIEYKARWRCRTVIRIDRWHPSTKTCGACGASQAALSLADREWTCAACSTEHDRDVNAAKNIRAAGLAVLACGGGVSPAVLRHGGQSSVKQEPVSQGSGIPALKGQENVNSVSIPARRQGFRMCSTAVMDCARCN